MFIIMLNNMFIIFHFVIVLFIYDIKNNKNYNKKGK